MPHYIAAPHHCAKNVRRPSMPTEATIVHYDAFNAEPQIYGADVVFEASGEPVNTGQVNAEGQPIWRWPDPKIFGFVGRK